MKEVRLSQLFLAVGRVDVRVEESQVCEGVESFKTFVLCVFLRFPKPFLQCRGRGW